MTYQCRPCSDNDHAHCIGGTDCWCEPDHDFEDHDNYDADDMADRRQDRAEAAMDRQWGDHA